MPKIALCELNEPEVSLIPYIHHILEYLPRDCMSAVTYKNSTGVWSTAGGCEVEGANKCCWAKQNHFKKTGFIIIVVICLYLNRFSQGINA